MQMVLEQYKDLTYTVSLRKSQGGVMIQLRNSETNKIYQAVEILNNGTILRMHKIPANSGLPVDEKGRLILAIEESKKNAQTS